MKLPNNYELPKLPYLIRSAAYKDEVTFNCGILADFIRAYARAAIEPYKQRISELEAQLNTINRTYRVEEKQ